MSIRFIPYTSNTISVTEINHSISLVYLSISIQRVCIGLYSGGAFHSKVPQKHFSLCGGSVKTHVCQITRLWQNNAYPDVPPVRILLHYLILDPMKVFL